MSPISHDFEVYRGATFDEAVQWKAASGAVVDLQQYTGRLQVRTAAGTLVLELTTENDGIRMLADGSAQLFIDDDATKVLPLGLYRYDAKFRANGNGFVTVLLSGLFAVRNSVTVEEPTNG